VSEGTPTGTPAVTAPTNKSPVDRAQVETLLGTLFKLMEYPARLDFRDMADGALGVAVHFEGELPGVTQGKRSMLVDSIQFLVNKAINRPNVPRRWVNLGVNAFPEPRQQQPQQQAAQQRPSQPQAQAPGQKAAPAPAPSQPAQPGRPARNERNERNKQPERTAQPPAQQQRPPQAPRGGHDERSIEVAADPAWTAAGLALAQKAARLGRVYAVMMVGQDDRARLLAAGKGTTGQTTRAEGEGHWRRVTFMPDKVVPITRKPVMPDYPDDEDE
jgi:hypothetical protein